MKKKLQSTTAHLIFSVMAILAPAIFNCFNKWWVFIDNTVKIDGFCEMLMVFVIINAVILNFLTAFKVYKAKLCKKKAYKILYGITAFLGFALFVAAFCYCIPMFFDENAGTLKNTLAETFGKFIPLAAISYLALFFPAVPCKAKRVISAVVITCAALWFINDFFPLTPYKITSDPMVIDTSEEYSVVFSTNDYGTAYVEYTFEGKDYKIYDHTAGRLNTDKKIHNIPVPYEHLRNNTYKVGSTRVIEDFSYGSRLGKEIVSEEYTLTYNDSDNQTYLVISDWHTMLDEANSAIDYLGDYDAVILLGDSAPSVDYENDVIRNTVQFGGAVSAGTKPIIYVRGNHETRGSFANDLPQVLGLDELYYTTDVGPYSFIVLDSGEDKVDSHREYGGLTTYGSYRADMIEWLKTAEATNDKVITLSHSYRICDVEEELSLTGWNEIDRIGARLILSGHTHQCRLLSAENGGKEGELLTAHPNIIGYMDGGKNGETYIASRLTLTAEGFTLEAVNNHGEEILKESFTW